MLYKLGDKQPALIGSGHFIAPSASVIGNVTLHQESSIWFSTVLRGDADHIEIGAFSNIQDNSTVHVDEGYPVSVGERVTVGHGVTLHGCTIGDNTLIGIGAIILNGATIGKNCLVAANSLILEGVTIPDGSVVMGSPARIFGEAREDQLALLDLGAEEYINKAKRYLKQFEEIGKT